MDKINVLFTGDENTDLSPLINNIRLHYGFSEKRLEIYNRCTIDKNNLISEWCKFDTVIYIKDSGKSNLGCFIGHPHLRCFNMGKDIEVQIIKELDNELNNIELEKKLLIEMPDFDALSKYNPFKCDIEQIYLLCENGSHRIRKRGDGKSFAYFETLKVRISGQMCYEYESIIDEARYNELRSVANPEKHPIVKNRYCFLYRNKYFELDVFPFWLDKAIIELELTDENEHFSLPPEIKAISDVSDDPEYKNNYLASVIFDENC